MDLHPVPLDEVRDTAKQIEIEKRRCAVQRYYLQGWQQWKIAEHLGVDRTTVSRDLTAQRKQWLESAAIDFSEAQARELAKIDLMETEAWEQWELSKKVRHTSSRKETKSDRLGNKMEASVSEEQREGNQTHMETIKWCVNKRCQLLGLDTPQKFALTTPDGKSEYGLGATGPVAALFAELQGALAGLSQGSGETNGTGTGETTGTVVVAATGGADGSVSE